LRQKASRPTLSNPSLSVQKPDGTLDVLYEAQDHQRPFHESTLPNLVMLGPRGSGKSLSLRMDAHMRACLIPDFKYLVVRRRIPELKRSHLVYINGEMRRLGGDFHNTDNIARYPNGSKGWYGHCDTPDAMLRYLSSEYDAVYIDEMSTFDGETVLKLASCARVPEGSGRTALLRGGTNKLGPGAAFVRKYFEDKDVSPEEDPDYNPDDWGIINHKFTDNKKIDQAQYRARLSSQGAQTRKAWLDNEWVIEGAYFEDFQPTRDGEPWHVIDEMPQFQGQSFLSQPWLNIYRAIDWGYNPDPAVCLWFAVLPNGRTIAFKEMTWKSTNAADVARQIKAASQGMRIVATACDPTMCIQDGKGAFSIGDIFEQNGVQLEPSKNKRDVYGEALHFALNTLIDEKPKLQILSKQGAYGCPNLIRTFPMQLVDPRDPNKLADGEDHWICAASYHFMSQAPASRPTDNPSIPRYLMPQWQSSLYARILASRA